MEAANDLLTGELFYKKKSSQRFANRQNQIRYNNQKAARQRKEKAAFTKGLDRNRKILKSILGNAPEVIRSRDFLLGAGFNFKLQTHTISKERELWHCIYDMAYTQKDNNTFKIAKA